MGRRVPILLAAIVAVIAVADPLFCPDGCGNEPITAGDHGSTPPTGDCIFCQAGALEPESRIVSEPAIVVTRISTSDERVPFWLQLDPLEHPPRGV